MGKKTFSGGLHPPGNKKHTSQKQIKELPLPQRVVIPLQQHLGAPSKSIVSVGDMVKTGQKISEPGGFVSVPSHAPITGKVTGAGKFPHPFGMNLDSIVIEADGEDTFVEGIEYNSDYLSLSKEEMIKRIQNAGLAGMGGAAFPTHVKLSPPPDKRIETVILNGAECEPYLTSDHRLMLEKPKEILLGLQLIMKILGAKMGFVGIESNKPDAVESIKDALEEINISNVFVEVVQVKYPQGAEKQLINAITGKKVPAGGLPMDVQSLVQNVGSALAIYEAVAYNKPLIERIVTVTGSAVKEPGNLKARIGTLFSELVEFCGGYTSETVKLINGGPMMGTAQFNDTVPVIKGTSGILVLNPDESKLPEPEDCILCARCVDVCPMKLMPCSLGTLVEYEKFDNLSEYNILDCIECGCCTYICPSKRNLIHLLRHGKNTLRRMQKKAG